MLAALQLEISADFWTVVCRRKENDLPYELHQGNKFVYTEGPTGGYYMVFGNRSIAVEYINERWYFLEYNKGLGQYTTKATLALTNEQLEQCRLACQATPPTSSIAELCASSKVPEEEEDTPTKGKEKAPIVYDDSDNDSNYHPVHGPPTPAIARRAKDTVTKQEIEVVAAGIEHIATLEHAEHLQSDVLHQRPHLTNIELAIQEGLPVPHYPPIMATTEEIKELEQALQVNITRANAPAPEVPPRDGTTATNGNGNGGKALISPPEVFTGDRNKADDFLQDFRLCWHLNRTHPAMKVPYDRVMLALSYMRGNTAIRNWVKHVMHQINKMIDRRRFQPLKVDDERLWGVFQTEFKTAFTNTTKVQDAEAALEHIRIQQGENIDQYIACFEDLMERAQWGERDRMLRSWALGPIFPFIFRSPFSFLTAMYL